MFWLASDNQSDLDILMMGPVDRTDSDFRTDNRGFTMLEILVTVAILAALTTVATFYVQQYIIFAHTNSDKQTLTVLNDTLTRYKTQGGGTSGLTYASQISGVLSRMQHAITWGGMGHLVMQSGVTYPGRSIAATGTGAQYHFTRFNTYSETDYASGDEAGNTPPYYPYGQGVGYETNGGNASGHSVLVGSSSGWFAVKDASGNITYAASWYADDIGPTASLTFWSCAGNGNPTPSGTITGWYDDGGNSNDFNSNLTAVDLRGLTGLTQASCANNGTVTSLNVSGLTSLQDLDCQSNQLTSLNISGLTSLSNFSCDYNQLTSLSVSGLTNLTYFSCQSNQITSLNVSGLTNLQMLDCDSNQLTSLSGVSGLTSLRDLTCQHNLLTSLNVSGDTSLNEFVCWYNNLGNINITGHRPSTFIYTPQNGGYTPNVTGP